jgi:hypothetical protein
MTTNMSLALRFPMLQPLASMQGALMLDGIELTSLVGIPNVLWAGVTRAQG